MNKFHLIFGWFVMSIAMLCGCAEASVNVNSNIEVSEDVSLSDNNKSTESITEDLHAEETKTTTEAFAEEVSTLEEVKDTEEVSVEEGSNEVTNETEQEPESDVKTYSVAKTGGYTPTPHVTEFGTYPVVNFEVKMTVYGSFDEDMNFIEENREFWYVINGTEITGVYKQFSFGPREFVLWNGSEAELSATTCYIFGYPLYNNSTDAKNAAVKGGSSSINFYSNDLYARAEDFEFVMECNNEIYAVLDACYRDIDEQIKADGGIVITFYY